MSKSTSMLPPLAGGSGVLAHTLTDADLMKVVDAVTLNANRDRKVTLAELKAAIVAPSVTALDARVLVLEADKPSLDALKAYADAATYTPTGLTSGVPTVALQLAFPGTTAGVWEVSGMVDVLAATGAETIVEVGYNPSGGVTQYHTVRSNHVIPADKHTTAIIPPSTITVTSGSGRYIEIYVTAKVAGAFAISATMHARRLS